MDAVVTGVENFGMFVQGTALPAEGLVRADSLVDDFYHYDRAMHALVGRRTSNTYRLGDLLRVVVARVDLDRRELDFRLAGGGKPARPFRGRSPRRGEGSRRGATSDRRSARTPKRKPKGTGKRR
jgi:ribonuclease R